MEHVIVLTKEQVKSEILKQHNHKELEDILKDYNAKNQISDLKNIKIGSKEVYYASCLQDIVEEHETLDRAISNGKHLFMSHIAETNKYFTFKLFVVNSSYEIYCLNGYDKGVLVKIPKI
jgi:hypothetical protein